jgi:glycosyltransferase involved in cell wall biosynthesis
LRALVVSQYYWPESFRINDVVKSLSEKGVEVEVLTGKPNYPRGKVFDGYKAWGCKQEIHQGVCIHRVPLFPRGRGGWRLALNYLSFVISGMLCAPWLLSGKKFDVIFVYAPSPILQAIPAIFFGWLKGCPVVLWVQDLWPESLSATGHVKNKLVLQLVERVVRFIYRHVDLLLVQSQGFVDPVSALASGTSVKYYPNSVDESFSAPATAPVPEIPGLGDGFSIMFAGNIGSAQGIEVIVEAATILRMHNDIQFIVLGDGSRRDWMLQEVRNRNLNNLHLPGRRPIEMMPGLMQKASVLLVSLTDQDIFRRTIPSKIQAYLAAGRPILACLNGEGASLVVASGAGMAVPAEDGKSLAKAILQMYGLSQQERDAMGANGRLYYKQYFSHDMLVDRLISLLQLCITDSKKKIE